MADSTTVLTYTVKVNTAGGTASVKKVRDAFDDLSRQAKKNLSEAGQKFDGLFSKLTNLNLGLELAKKAFHLLSTPIEKIISVGSKFEDLQLQLETVLQSADRAKEYFTWIKDFAAKTPFQMEGLTESVIMLESFGIDGQKYLRTFGDAAAGLKIPLNELSRVMGQIFAKPTAQAEEMLQLTERGVPVMRILRQELGLTAAQVGNIGREGIAGQNIRSPGRRYG
jgi:tape measure domain-containing protein